VVDIPGALPDHGHKRTVAAELFGFHFNSLIFAIGTVPVTIDDSICAVDPASASS
jgi:hypothetical protein